MPKVPLSSSSTRRAGKARQFGFDQAYLEACL